MYRFWFFLSILLLSLFVLWCNNKFNCDNVQNFNLDTEKWRQEYCENALVDKYGEDFDVEWDSDGGYASGFIIGGLLYIGDRYYDLECQWNKSFVELQLNPVDELKYENMYYE